jgi:23S rRNA (uracil1939-C5)-methyltransferase
VTLERDLAYLTKRGYQAKKVVPVDMFPGTEHVEVITLLQKALSKNIRKDAELTY